MDVKNSLTGETGRVSCPHPEKTAKEVEELIKADATIVEEDHGMVRPIPRYGVTDPVDYR